MTKEIDDGIRWDLHMVFDDNIQSTVRFNTRSEIQEIINRIFMASVNTRDFLVHVYDKDDYIHIIRTDKLVHVRMNRVDMNRRRSSQKL